MSIVEKITTIAENVPKVYEAGQKSEHDRFWDAYLRSPYWPYRFAGQGWTDSTFRPTKDVVVTGNANALFRETGIADLAKRLADNNVVLDLSGTTSTTYLFGFSTSLKTVSMKISEPNEDSSIIFVNTSFQNCTNLTTMSITGILATNGLNLQWSPLLDRDSLLNIIDCLKDYSTDPSDTGLYITIGDENVAKLTEDELKIANNKGWDVR